MNLIVQNLQSKLMVNSPALQSIEVRSKFGNNGGVEVD